MRSATSSLGTALVEGVSATGTEYRLLIPASEQRGNGTPIEKTVQLWTSSDVQLTVHLSVSDRTSGDTAQTYKNIQTGVVLAGSLFQTPAGYQEVSSLAETAQAANRKCKIDIGPDPLVISSFGFFWGSGTMTAISNINRGCVFVQDGAILEYPLSGFPTIDLGFPVDQWVVFDGGGFLPFTPWVAFGDIIFVATNGVSVKVKDGLVILVVYF